VRIRRVAGDALETTFAVSWFKSIGDTPISIVRLGVKWSTRLWFHGSMP